MQRAHSVLKDVFGFGTFWPLQEKIIAHILEKKRCPGRHAHGWRQVPLLSDPRVDLRTA